MFMRSFFDRCRRRPAAAVCCCRLLADFHAVTRESARQQRLVRALVLVDAMDISASTLWNINVVKSVAAIGPEYYPECTEKVFIVRAPWLITKVFAAVSALLPERTRCVGTARSAPMPPCKPVTWVL